ncbi:hypothetical protein ABDK00_008410 [Niabella insulamsoli]|uniref:hypothetical protein n=1 Tax=Niabella insulamsoli TaxID=3144874 RepID=UPI0031FBF5FB
MQHYLFDESEELEHYKRLHKTRSTAIFIFFFVGMVLGGLLTYNLIYFGQIVLPDKAIENQLDAGQEL